MEASGTTLTEIFGVGPILAGRIIGTVGNVVRFPTKAHFASYSGTAPVEASSGEVVRHRLSLAGNRKLNYALHMVAICPARSDAQGGAYYREKIAEGKSRKEALRCLKRRISDAVFRSLVADSQAPSRSAAYKEEPRIGFVLTYQLPIIRLLRGFWSHSSRRTAYRYSLDHLPLNHAFSTKAPSRRMPSRSSRATEGAFSWSVIA